MLCGFYFKKVDRKNDFLKYSRTLVLAHKECEKILSYFSFLITVYHRQRLTFIPNEIKQNITHFPSVTK